MKDKSESSKIASYTSHRPDITSCIPETIIRVLDVGCSNGMLGSSLKSKSLLRRVTGIEFDESFCIEARKHLDSVIQGDLNHFEWDKYFESNSFDCLIFADVLEHLIDPWNTLKNAVDFLAKDGLVVISLPNIRHISAFNSIYINGSFPKINRGIFDQTHLRWFTKHDGLKLCKQANLTIKNVIPRLRIRDMPGGIINNFIEKNHKLVPSSNLIEEFLAYQFIFIATKN